MAKKAGTSSIQPSTHLVEQPGWSVYRVRESQVSAICQGKQCYPVIEGLARLPEGEAWVAEMVQAGDLVKV